MINSQKCNYAGYYEKVKYDIFCFMNDNNIRELFVWCCRHETTSDGSCLGEIKPSQYVITIPKELPVGYYYEKQLGFYKVLKNGEFGEINRINNIKQCNGGMGTYIAFNEKDCEKEYNKQLYQSINKIQQIIENLQLKQINLNKKINSINNKFIKSDYTMEVLIHEYR